MPQRIHLAIVFALSTAMAGCNTFGADPFPEEDSNPADASVTTDANNDAGVDPGGEDVIWTPEETGLPAIGLTDVSEELEVCPGSAVELTNELAEEPEVHLDTVVSGIPAVGERLIATYVEFGGKLKIDLIDTETTTAENLFESADTLNPRVDGTLVGTHTIGAQLLVAFVDESQNLHLVQCSLDGPPTCRTESLGDLGSIEAVEVGARSATFFLYLALSGESIVREFRISADEELLSAGPPQNIDLGQADRVRSIDFGVIAGDVDTLAFSVEVTEGTFYRFARYVNSNWQFDAGVQDQMVVSAERPRAVFRHLSSDAYVTQADGAGVISIDNLVFVGTQWTHGQNWGTDRRDFDFTAIENGFAEAFVVNQGWTKLLINVGGDVAQDTNVSIGGELLIAEWPTRVAVSDGALAIVARKSDKLFFYEFCDETI